MIRISRAASLLGGLLAVSVGPSAAQVPEQILRKPDASYAEPFSMIRGLRELADGRLMIADPLEQMLAIIDMRTGDIETLGSVGPGPGEYRQPDGLFALPGESTLLVDLGNARLTVLGPDGSFGETMPITQGEPGPGGGLRIILPQGTDSQGRVYFEPMGGRAPGAGLPDSVPVVRYDRARGAMDTLLQVGLPRMKRSISGSARDQRTQISPVPLSPEDAWAVAWDGRVALARASDYHVEWIGPGGRVVRGERVEFQPVPIRRADKEEWVENLGGGLMVGVTIDDGERRVSFRRGGGAGASVDIDGFEWPDTKPAFVSNGVYVTPEGDIWVRRHVPAGEPPMIDVFGEDANLKARLRLPEGRRIVGFGRGTLYLIRTDEDGLQWLERYRRTTWEHG